MRTTRLITSALVGSTFAVAVLFSLGAGGGGLVHFYGSTTLTNLLTGYVYVQTNAPVGFFVGGAGNTPVMVGVQGVATTGNIATAAGSCVATNDPRYLAALTGSVTAVSLLITNVFPGTNGCWLVSDDGTNFYWRTP